jgi:hypothetical protein
MNGITKSLLGAAFAMSLCAGAGSASSAVLAQELGGPDISTGAYYWGESFTTIAGSGFDNITVNFYAPDGSSLAAGTGYIFASAYGGTVSGLSSAGALASATSASNVWSFASGFTLAGNTTYYFYEDALLQLTGNDPATEGHYSASFASNESFTPELSRSLNFTVNGSDAGVPEPFAWALMLTGFGGVGLVLRRGRRAHLPAVA